MPDEAIKVYKKILKILPEHTDVILDIVRLLNHTGKKDEAEEILFNSLNKGSIDVRLMNQYALILQSKGWVDKALHYLKKSIQAKPDYPETYTLLGNLMCDIGHIDNAVACYKTALHYDNSNCVAYNNIAIAYKDNHEIARSLENFSVALNLCPEDPYIHWNYALTLLLAGNYEDGFREYEWRWLKPDYKMYERVYDCKKWDVSETDKRIVIFAEQGIGDTIQFSRYAEYLSSKGLEVTIHCHRELVRLMKHVKAVSSAISFEEKAEAKDCYYPIMSLPFMCNTNLKTIPNNIPYIKPDDSDLGKWSDMVNQHKKRINIGLAWAGNPKHPNDKRRSIPFEYLLPLFEVKDVAFFSLQIPNPQGIRPPFLLDFTEEISDFYDTACLIKCLDMIITTDTAVGHLAGALGKDVWIMLPYSPDWRWLLNTKISPWYPTARLFRQSQRDDWSGVVNEVKDKLNNSLKSNMYVG